MRIGALALVAAIGIGSGGAAQAVEYVAGTRATFQWAAASGPLAGYAVLVSRNGGPFLLAAVTAASEPRYTVPAALGDEIRIQVAAYTVEGGGAVLGPPSVPSDVVAFVAQRPRALIPGLYSTGVHADGSVQGSYRQELHYAYSGPAAGAKTLVKRPRWATPPPGAEWIGPDAQWAPAGTYVYTLQFELADRDPRTAFVAGYWAADEGCEIRLNGAPTGVNVASGWDALRPFLINSGFVAGTNRLEFHVRNEGPGWTPTGLVVGNLFGSAELTRGP